MRFRNSPRYQRGMQVFKWRVLPDWVFLPIIVFIAVWLGAGGVTQAWLPWLESGTALCTSRGRGLPPLTTYQHAFNPGEPCHPVGEQVERDTRYRVELRVTEPWFDGSHPTNPTGLRARDLGPIGILGGPFRRVIEANYLQPVIAIRRPPGSRRLDHVHINPLTVVEQEPGLFAGEFKAPESGELFVFANDAVWPGAPTYFYTSDRARNHGSAMLKIVRLGEAPTAAVVQPVVQARAGR